MSGVLAGLIGSSAATEDAVIAFSDTYVEAIGSGKSIFSQYQVNSDGFQYIDEDNGSGFVADGQWCAPAYLAGNYEVQATVFSGTLFSGTTGSWLDVSTDPEWAARQASVGFNICTLTMEVRKIGTTTVLDTWYVDLYAQRTS